MVEKKHRHQHMNPKFKDTIMINKLIIFIFSLIIPTLSFSAEVSDKTKQICKEVNKNGKSTKECKTIKVHKKLEGTKVPTDK